MQLVLPDAVYRGSHTTGDRRRRARTGQHVHTCEAASIGAPYHILRNNDMANKKTIHLCQQCGEDMGNEWILGPVCGKCCRKNQRKAAGK